MVKRLPLPPIVVLKVGTSTLVDGERLDKSSFKRIGRQIDKLRAEAYGVVLVSSAAHYRLPLLGWQPIVQAWKDAISSTVQDFLLQERELDVQGGCNHILAAMRAGSIVVTNAHRDIPPNHPYDNNDIVGARLVQHATDAGHRVHYVILSDVHGVYADPDNPDTLIPIIDDIKTYRRVAAGAGKGGSTGGMPTKFKAAEMAAEVGADTWIAHGRTEDAALLAVSGRIGTRFLSSSKQVA